MLHPFYLQGFIMDHINMRLEKRSVSELREYEYNSKLHPEAQIDIIANSIKAYDFNDPIGIDEDGIILEGHGRLRAAKKLGIEEVPVLVVSGFRNEKEKNLYRIAHNKLTLSTGFDVKKLADEIQALSQYEVIDVNAMGFDDRDLQAIMRQSSETSVSELPPPVFKYTLVFDDKQQQKVWKDFMAKLTVTNGGDNDTPTSLLMDYIKNSGVLS